MTNLLFSFLLALATSLSSPDGKLLVKIEQSEDSRLLYSIEYDGETLLSPSALGLKGDFRDYSRLIFESADTRDIRIDYSLDRIKQSRVQRDARRTLLHCKTPDGHPIDIEWHISNNDVAFRYNVIKDGETGSIRVMSEQTSFNFPSGTTTYLCPQSDAMVGWKRTKPSYEEYYKPGALMDEESEFGHGYTFPCLFKIPGAGWALVSETGVDSRYCGSRLGEYHKDGGYRIEFPMPEENNGNGTSEPAFALPGSTPWRTVTVGSDLAAIVETTIAFDVVEPRYESSHSYSYGKGSWSWILWQDASINYDDQVQYIDLASAMGFSFCLIDNYWDANIGRERMEELARYARSKNVDLFLWYSSSGWWNDITQGPVDIMSNPISRKQEMRWLESIGVKGIKVDFFGGDKQETMALYEAILSDADDHGLMVIFHGCTLPRGWERMYPNYVGSEAVRASENLIFGQYECEQEAIHASLYPFIRNAVGSMEFGGTFLNKVLERNNGKPDSKGRVRGTRRITTDAFELATAVLFQNPIQNFALAPNNLEDAPGLALDFMREVPTTWDETRFIDGEPGQNVAIARRHGDTWYIGAVNASEEDFLIDVAALEQRFGGKAEVLGTVSTKLKGSSEKKTELSRIVNFKKPLRISQNDGVAIIIR